MKYLKHFENIQDDSWKNKNYKSGDYVLISSRYKDIVKEPVIIDDETDEDIFACSFINKEGGVEVFVDDIVRKLKDYEIAALKYNL